MRNRSSIDVEVLVVDDKLLGFDLLLGFDMGGAYVSSDGTVRFPQLDRHLCAAITINETDSIRSMTRTRRLCLGSDLVTKPLREEYTHKQRTWMDNA